MHSASTGLGFGRFIWSQLVSVIAVTGMVLCVNAHAQTTISALINQSCAGTRFGSNLGCTANDVSASITFAQPAANTLTSCIAGSTVTVDVIATLGSGMPNRYDLGIFFGESNNDPQLNNAANTCSLGVFPNTPSPFSNFDGDVCGDFAGGQANIPLLITGVKVKCAPQAGTNSVAIPFLLSWSQSNSPSATCVADLAPGTQSKCSASTAGTVTQLISYGFVNLTKATLRAGDAQSFSFSSVASGGQTPDWTLAGSPSSQTLTHGQTKRIAVPLSSTGGTQTLTITEALSTFWEPGVTISCVAAAGATGNPATVNNATRTITAALTGANYGADCTITNTKRSRITIAKSIAGRAVSTDQFTVTATGGGTLTDTAGTTIVSPVNVTTTGINTSAQTSFWSQPAQAVTISETAASGSLADYISTYACINATAGSATVMPAAAGTGFALTPAAGDDITCTFTNTPKPILTKAFAVSSLAVNQTTTLTFTINNVAGALAQTGITFTDAFPAGLVIAGTPGVVNSCGGTPTITATANAGSFAIGGTGVNAAAGVSSCTISVNVTSATAGSYTNGAAQITAVSGNLKNGVTNQVLNFFSAPTVTKSFSPLTIVVGGASTLTIIVTNPSANPANLTGVSINDIYTGTLQNNATGSVTCSSAGSATLSGGVNGGTSVGFAAGTIIPGGTCTITQGVTATSTNNNTTNTPTATGPVSLTGLAAGATLTVGNAIGVAKSFGINPVALNTNSLLTITLTNTNASAASGVAFTDTYPANLVNNGGAVVSNTCGGTVAVSANATNPGVTSLSGGAIPANGNCVITVNTRSATAGSYTNTIATGGVTSTNTPANTQSASDTLLVGTAKLDKSFGSALALGGTVTLTYSVINTAAVAVSFTDTLPAGLRVASSPNVGGTCTGGTVTATALGNTITVASRNSINGTCTITVAITTATSFTLGTCPQANNTNGNSNISATTNIGADITNSAAGGGTSNTGACVTVTATAPTISKTFAVANIASGGNTNLTLTIGNSNAGAIALTSVLTDTFPAGMTINTAGNTGTCVGVTATAGAGNFSIANGTNIPAGGCTVIVNVTSSTAGAALNNIAIGALQTNVGSNATAASATLNVYAPPTVTKSFTPATIGVGGTSSMVITVTNPAANVGNITGVVITDTYIGTLVNNAAGSVLCSGAGTATLSGGVNAGTSVGFTAGTIVPGGTCTITQSVSATSTNLNTTSAPTATGPVALTGTAANATLTVTLATVAKTFTSASINDGGSTSLRFTLTNAAALAQTGIVLNDTLPVGLRYLTTTPAVSYIGTGGTCTGPATASYNIGTRVLTISGISLGVGTTSCNVDVAGLTNAAGQTGTCPIAAQTNLIANVTATNATVAGSDQCLSVAALPTLTKAFGAANIAVNGTTTLTFSITNTATGNIARSGLNFTDTLQAGIQIANSPVPTSVNCGTPVFTAVNASQPFTASSIDVAANTTCTITLTVRGVTVGARSNTAADITAINALLSNGVTTQTLNVYAPPTISKLFGTNPINAGASSALTFTITNPAANPGVINTIAFTDLFPTTPGAMTLANATTSTTCGGTVEGRTGAGAFGAPVTGNSEIRLTGATTLAAGASCTVVVNVTAGVSGTYVNTSSTVTAVSAVGAVALTGTTASDTLNVNALAVPIITKTYLTANIAVGGTSTLRITAQNTNLVAITGAAFTDTYPAGTTGALTATAAPAGCTGSLTATAASLVLASGVIPAATTCTYDVVITGNTAGAKLNSTGAVTSNNAPNGTAASATLNVYAPPTISKAFAGPIDTSGVTTLTFTFTNPAANPGIVSGIAVSDTLPTAPGAMTIFNGVVGGTCTATVLNQSAMVLAASDTGVQISGISLAAGASCTVVVNVTANIAGNYVNTTSVVTANAPVVLTGTTASDTLVVRPRPLLTKSFAAVNIGVGQTTTLTFTIDNTAVGAVNRTGLGFVDTLPGAGALTAVVSSPQCGGGTVVVSGANNNVITVAGAAVNSATSCTITATITGVTPGSYINGPTNASISGVTANLINNVVDQTLNVRQATVAKTFAAASINDGFTTSMVFTLVNGTGNPSQAGLVLGDTLPTGLRFDTITPVMTYSAGCSGPALAAYDTMTRVLSGVTPIAMTGGTVSCTVSIAGLTNAPTQINSSCAANPAAFTNLAANVTTTRATNISTDQCLLLGLVNPTLSKAWSASPINDGAVTNLVFTLTNSGTNPAQSGISFTESLPASLRFNSASPTVIFGAGCAGSSIVTQGTPDTIAVSAVTMTATTASCTITVAAVTNRAGILNSSCAASPAAFTNTSANIAPSSGVINGVTSQCLIVNSQPPVLTKAWGAASIVDGASTPLIFTLTNTGTNPAQSGVAFTESLPTALRFTGAAPTVVFGSGCSGSSAVVQGTPDTIALSSVAMTNTTASCTITVTGVTNRAGQVNASCGSSPAAFTNTSTRISATTNVTNSVTPQCLQVTTQVPTIAKAFSPTTIAVGGTSTVTLTITNANSVALTSAGFTDTLTNMRISGAQNAAGTCVGAASNAFANNQTGLLTFGGLTIPASGSCTVTVLITSSTPGMLNNSTSGVSSAEAATGAVSNTATLTVNAAAPSIVKTFVTPSIALGGTSQIDFTINNPNAVALTGAAFTDTLSNMFVHATAAATGTCTGAGSNNFTVNQTGLLNFNGLTIPASGACTVSIVVRSNTVGTHPNFATGVSSIEAPTGASSASVNLTVTATAPTISKTFLTSPIASGASSTLQITISNSNAAAITVTSVTDTFPTSPDTGMVRAATPNAATTCAGGVVTSGAGSVTLTGGTVPATGSCTFQIDVTAAIAGAYNNTIAIGALTTSAGTNTVAANATLNVTPTANVSVSKSAPATIAWGATITYTVVVSNAGPDGANLTAFSDTVPAAVTGVNAVCGLPTGGAVCGTVNIVGNSVTSTIATLPSGGTVTFTITGTTPQTGTLSNVATAIVPMGITDPDDPTRVGAGNNTSPATVTIVQAPDLRATKTSTSSSLTVGVNARFTLTPSNSGSLATSGTVTVIDTLPTGLTYVPAGSGGTGWTCGVSGQVVTCTSSTVIAAAGTGNAITINVQVLSSAAPGITNFATIGGGNEPSGNTGNNSTVLALPVGSSATNAFLTDGAATGLPGASVLYTHTFVVGVTGSVSFASMHTPSPNIFGWTVQLFRDNNCNGVMDGIDGVAEITATNFAVTAGQQLCIIVKSNIPASASLGAQDIISVTATFTPISGPVVTYTRVDITTVGSPQGAGLALMKSVRNVTLGGVAGTTNTARPGDMLEYIISYSNSSNSNLATIALADVTPAFTSFVSASCVMPYPNNITSCAPSTQPSVGGAGAIQWTVTGLLVPGQTGSVLFRVTVQ